MLKLKFFSKFLRSVYNGFLRLSFSNNCFATIPQIINTCLVEFCREQNVVSYSIKLNLSKTQFIDLYKSLNGATYFQRILLIDALGLYLTRLYMGLSTKATCDLLGFCTYDQGLEAIKLIRAILVEKFVKNNLGLECMSRDTIINQRTTHLAKRLFETDENTLITVLDGTYVYIEKPSDYVFQKNTYNMHKGRPLVKMMIIVSTSGYILDTFGPYLSNSANNDASILKHLMNKYRKTVNDFFNENDLFIVDRGFRDSIEFMNELGFNVEMPTFLHKASQHTTEEANKSRIITKVRWVVEAVNGAIKKWKYFKNIIPNSNIKYVADDFKIVCALINKYRADRTKVNKSNDESIASSMLAKLNCKNHLIDLVKTLPKKSNKNNLITDLKSIDFPLLTESFIRSITFGVYQLKQAKEYTKQNLSEDSKYSFEIFQEKQFKNLLRVEIKSRHCSRVLYNTYIMFSNDSVPIKHWYCICKCGSRVVGTCAHIASVIWYLGVLRLNYNKLPKNIGSTFNELCENASEELDCSSNEEDDPAEMSDD